VWIGLSGSRPQIAPVGVHGAQRLNELTNVHGRHDAAEVERDKTPPMQSMNGVRAELNIGMSPSDRESPAG
jgi:hypothetical protein